MDLCKERKNGEGMIEISCKENQDAGRVIVYRLYQDRSYKDCYEIEIHDADGTETGRLYGSLSSVSDLFERMADGRVRSYILGELLEDFASSKCK